MEVRDVQLAFGRVHFLFRIVNGSKILFVDSAEKIFKVNKIKLNYKNFNFIDSVSGQQEKNKNANAAAI